MVEKKWILPDSDDAHTEILHTALGINKTICKVLAARGIQSFEAARHFFRPDASMLHDPFLMRDMEQAVKRINQAVLNKEHVRIYGDYDVDGTTAVAMLYAFLKKWAPGNPRLSFYIPNRYKEGYGISDTGIDDAIAHQCTLMIVLDCGIKSIDKVQRAKAGGMDVIICDHHLPDEELPEAVAILNPKQKECAYPYKELSACGIGYKLICGLQQYWNISADSVNEYMDLLAASIASDIVPMTGENRVLASLGLLKANANPCVALQVLKETAGIHSRMNISNLVFMIGPRINAAGRMNDANKVISLLIEEDTKKATALAALLHADNQERIDIDKAITAEALAMLENVSFNNSRSIVLHNETWHKGVVGIVASRVIEHHYKPTIILTTSDGKVTGSARSVASFDIHEAIASCSEYLDTYGGHRFAAGLTMQQGQVEHFKAAFESVVSSTITEASLLPILEIDAELPLDELSLTFLNIIEQFEPCGPQNMAPVFVARNVRDSGSSRIVKEKHLQVHIRQGSGPVFKGIAFNMASWYEYLRSGLPVDIAFHVQKNEWNGKVSPELRILDIKKSTV